MLNAQSQLFQTKRDLAVARYSVLLGNLKLRQANGTLVPEDLNAIDAALATHGRTPVDSAAPVSVSRRTPARQ
ncbi:subunit of efflux pump conferring antibiotic resistance [compost metagenome]